MFRLALLAVGTAGLLFTAYIDKPENYAHDAIFPAPAAATTTTGAAVVGPPEAPATTPTIAITVTTTTRQESSTVPATSTSTIPAGAKCPEWWGYVGKFFDADEIPIVDAIMWAESRCQPDVISPTRDYGLMQINWAVWGDTINAHGFTHDDLLDPSVNIMWAFLIAHEAERIGWCTWKPWYMSGQWC